MTARAVVPTVFIVVPTATVLLIDGADLVLPGIVTAADAVAQKNGCGPKRDRTHYLPEEIDTLTTLAHRAGASYGWLTMRAPSIPQGDSMVEAL